MGEKTGSKLLGNPQYVCKANLVLSVGVEAEQRVVPGLFVVLYQEVLLKCPLCRLYVEFLWTSEYYELPPRSPKSSPYLRVEVVVLVQETHHRLQRLLDGRQRGCVCQRDLAFLAYRQVLL